jgi:hypothetical protein
MGRLLSALQRLNKRMRFRSPGLAVVAAAVLAISPLVLPTASPGTLPFAPGETLTYSLTWSVFPAGQLVATLSRPGRSTGDPYEVRIVAHSRGFVSLLYQVHDEFRSDFDPINMCSLQISKSIQEGRRHKETRIVFDSQRKRAILDERDLSRSGDPPKHAETEIPGCVADLVSAFYYLRAQPMQVGQQILVPVNDGSKTSEVTVHVQAREEIQTPVGRRFAFRLEPTVFGQLYKRKGRMLIWLSDDPQRLPLRIKAMISVGTLVGELQSATQPLTGAK